MGAIDYSPLQVGKPGFMDSFLDPVLDAAHRAAADRAKQDEEEQKYAFMREQEARRTAEDNRRFAIGDRRQARLDRQAEASAGLNERRNTGTRTLENETARQTREKQIRAAVAAEGPDSPTAQGLSSYAEVDPATGQVQRRQLYQKVPGGPAPEAPHLEPATPPVEGPRISPDDAERADLQRSLDQEGEITTSRDARSAMEANDTARAHNDVSTESYNRQVGAYQAEQANPRIQIGDVQTTADDVRHAQGRQNAADYDQQVKVLRAQLDGALATGDPYLASQARRRLQQAETLRPAVEAGAIPLRAAAEAIDKSGVREDTRDLTERQGDANRVSAENRARIAASRPRVGGGGRGRATKPEGYVDPKVVAPTETALQHFAQQWDIKGNRAEEEKLGTLMANKDKTIVQRAMASVLSRGLAGEKGVLTEGDINRLQKDLGGAWTEVQNWLSKKGSGQLDPEIQQRLEEGITAVIQQKSAHRKAAGVAFHSKFLKPGSPYVGWGLEAHLRNAAGEMGLDLPDEQGAAPAGAPSGEDPAARKTRLLHELSGGQ